MADAVGVVQLACEEASLALTLLRAGAYRRDFVPGSLAEAVTVVARERDELKNDLNLVVVKKQLEENAIKEQYALQLRDRESGKTLLLHGPVEGDALLSAIDLLAAGSTTVAEPAHSPDMPAGVAGDMPR